MMRSKMRKKKKAQMELMGIAIVVLLVSLVMMFVFNYTAKRKPAEYRKEFAGTELSTNIVKSLLATNAPECLGLTFNELWQDCAENYVTGGIPCDYRDSCGYAIDETEKILNATLGKWQVDYEFRVEWEEGTTRRKITIGQCPSTFKSKRTKPYPIYTNVGIMNILLYICY